MKKFFSLVLCFMLAISMLVSCGDEEIGKVPDHYPPNDSTIDDLKINMYIIVEGDTATGNAFDTVKRMVAQYTLATYHTEVNLIYCTAAEYENIVTDAVDATGSQFSKDTPDTPMCPVHVDADENETCDKCEGEYNTASQCTAIKCTDANNDGVCDNCKYVSDNKDAHIVLVNSYDLMETLVSTGKLANLAPYLEEDEFGTLNVQIPSALLEASMYDDLLYSIPNNHLLGEYRYLVINEEVAKQVLKESPSTLESYTTYEGTEALRAEMEEAGYDPTNYVYVQNGTYSLKAELEASGNVCNIISYPTVDKEEAFSSAFAVLDTSEEYNYRSMQIIYALNNDVELRNLIQYGVRGTNYNLSEDGEIIMVTDVDNAYRMKLEYTGNVFIASYCDEIGWTAEAAQNAAKQNAQATLKN